MIIGTRIYSLTRPNLQKLSALLDDEWNKNSEIISTLLEITEYVPYADQRAALTDFLEQWSDENIDYEPDLSDMYLLGMNQEEYIFIKKSTGEIYKSTIKEEPDIIYESIKEMMDENIRTGGLVTREVKVCRDMMNKILKVI